MSVLLDKLVNEVQHLLSEEEVQKRKERNKQKSMRQAFVCHFFFFPRNEMIVRH